MVEMCYPGAVAFALIIGDAYRRRRRRRRRREEGLNSVW